MPGLNLRPGNNESRGEKRMSSDVRVALYLFGDKKERIRDFRHGRHKLGLCFGIVPGCLKRFAVGPISFGHEAKWRGVRRWLIGANHRLADDSVEIGFE